MAGILRTYCLTQMGFLIEQQKKKAMPLGTASKLKTSGRKNFQM
jgi:hypothetical protein